MKTKLFALTLLGGVTLFVAPALANRHVYIGPAYDPGWYAPDIIYPTPYAVVPPPGAVYVAPVYVPPPVVEYLPPPVVEYEPGPAIVVGE